MLKKNATVQIWATLLGETDSVISNGSSTVNITTIPSNFEVIIANDDRTKIAGFQFYDKLKIELLYIGNPDDYGPEAQLEHVIVRNLQDSGQSGIKFLPFSNYDTDHRTLLYSLDLQ